jgi:hypothetical protein
MRTAICLTPDRRFFGPALCVAEQIVDRGLPAEADTLLVCEKADILPHMDRLALRDRIKIVATSFAPLIGAAPATPNGSHAIYRRLVLDREHFKLVSQSGEWFPVASQRHFVDAAKQIQALRQNASVWRRDLGSYLGALNLRERLKFFALPGEGVVITGALLDKDRNTFGELYFEMPRGAWDEGDYALLIEHPQARIKLPISLE